MVAVGRGVLVVVVAVRGEGAVLRSPVGVGDVGGVVRSVVGRAGFIAVVGGMGGIGPSSEDDHVTVAPGRRVQKHVSGLQFFFGDDVGHAGQGDGGQRLSQAPRHGYEPGAVRTVGAVLVRVVVGLAVWHLRRGPTLGPGDDVLRGDGLRGARPCDEQPSQQDQRNDGCPCCPQRPLPGHTYPRHRQHRLATGCRESTE